MKAPWPSPSSRPSWMPISERLQQLGSGVFARVDDSKRRYRGSAAAAQRPLIDLSLGSPDLPPPPVALEAMGSLWL